MVVAIAIRGVPQGRHSVLFLVVGKRKPVLFVQIAGALAWSVDIEDERVQGLGVGVVAYALLGDERSFANKYRCFIHGVVRGESAAPRVAPAVEEIDPLTRWKIDGLITARIVHRSDQHLVSEEVFVRMAVSLFELRVLEVQRPQYWERLTVRQPCVRIQVRNQLRAQGEVLLHQRDALSAVDPGHAQVALAGVGVSAVHPQERAEAAELDPARIQVEIDLLTVKSTDVMTDVGNQHVAATGRERDLVGEYWPLRIRVAGKERRISLAAPFAVAAQDGSAPASLLLHVIEEDLVGP